MMPWHLCFTGLPATGKSTLARALARESGALWVRLDEIETAMRQSHMETPDLADGGYAAAQAVTRGALAQGFNVISDCVNPIGLTRKAWRAASDGHVHLDVELCCSDQQLHKTRVESRENEISGHRLPDWRAVQTRLYEPMPEADLCLDTSRQSLDACLARLLTLIATKNNEVRDV